MAHLKIHVTYGDIWDGFYQGIADAGRTCPIALAIRRVEGDDTIIVGTLGAHSAPPDEGTGAAWWLSRRARRFVQDFDAWGPEGVEASTFILEVR